VGSNACREDVRPAFIQADLDEAGTEHQSTLCRFVYGLNNVVKGIDLVANNKDELAGG
jgi:hypothetical protein